MNIFELIHLLEKENISFEYRSNNEGTALRIINTKDYFYLVDFLGYIDKFDAEGYVRFIHNGDLLLVERKSKFCDYIFKESKNEH